MTGSLKRLDRMLAITGLHISHPTESLLTPVASIIALEVVSFFNLDDPSVSSQKSVKNILLT